MNHDAGSGTTTQSETTVGRNKKRNGSFFIPMEVEVMRKVTRADGQSREGDEEKIVGRSTGWLAFDGQSAAVATGDEVGIAEQQRGVVDRSLFFMWARQRWAYFKIGLWGLKNLVTTGKIRGS